MIVHDVSPFTSEENMKRMKLNKYKKVETTKAEILAISKEEKQNSLSYCTFNRESL